MPFPWKKNRVTRISRIVAEIQSPKRDSPFVVQTGFPTSLIDLFVKNRTRFTKPKPKKPHQPLISDPPPPPSPAPSPMPDTSGSSDLTVFRAEAPSTTPLVSVNSVDGGDDDAGSGSEVNRVGECGCGMGSKSVLAGFLKMLFVAAVLITSVKNLTVGITVSAFALLFLEFAGKRFVSCLRPCSGSKVGIKIEPLTQMVSNCVWFQKHQLSNNTKKDCEGSVSELAIFEGENVVVSEIEVVETKTCVVVGPELDCVNGDKKLCCPEMKEKEGSNGKVVDSREISRCESKGSRSVRFKSKMVKKLVPKKLRFSMKERRERKIKENEAESPWSDVAKEEENGNGSTALLPKIKLDCIREVEVDHGIMFCQESSMARVEEVAVVSEDNRNRVHQVGNSGYMILVVITLVGL